MKRINVKPFLTDALNKKQSGFDTFEILIILIFPLIYRLPLLDTNQQPSMAFSCQTGWLWPYLSYKHRKKARALSSRASPSICVCVCCVADEDHTSCDFYFLHFLLHGSSKLPVIAEKRITHILPVTLILYRKLSGIKREHNLCLYF